MSASAALVAAITHWSAPPPLASAAPALPPPQESPLSALNDSMANVVERILPAVVCVNVERRRVIEDIRPSTLGPITTKRNVREPGVGSGVIVSREGLALTNYHVVEGEEVLIMVTMHGSEEPRRATLIDSDKTADLALLQIEPKREGEVFSWMAFGDSDLMRPGNLVFALGAPLNLPETVTQGIISNRERRVSDTLISYLQTDCTINPGNSGGPLVNWKGELIGINTRLVIGPPQTASGQAYGLASPSNEVQDAYERMLSKGRPRGYLGVTVADWPEMSYQTGGKPEAAIVVGVEQGSPAAAAGLQKDDLILALDGEPVRSSAGFFRRLRKRQVGELLSLDLKRGQAPLQVQAKVAIFEAAESPESRVIAGLKLRTLRRAERARPAASSSGGLLVEDVAKGSLLERKVSKGDIILSGTEQPPEPGLSVTEHDAFAARMEILQLKGGYLDILRADGSTERISIQGH